MKRSELRHTIIRHLSRGNQTLREFISGPDNLRKGNKSIEHLKYPRVLISATPSFIDHL